MEINNAKKSDARNLAQLIDIAGEGIPMYFWSQMAGEDQTPFETGIQRAASEQGNFSYRNTRVARIGNCLAGMLIAYRLDNPYEMSDITDYPILIRPFLLLESRVPGSWYINALATREDCRGRGIATALMEDTETRARALGLASMSIIVASDNPEAKSLYLKQGFQQRGALPLVPLPGSNRSGNYELLAKQLDSPSG